MPVFDGTDKTIPKTLKDNTVIDQIEEINDGECVWSKVFIGQNRYAKAFLCRLVSTLSLERSINILVAISLIFILGF